MCRSAPTHQNFGNKTMRPVVQCDLLAGKELVDTPTPPLPGSDIDHADINADIDHADMSRQT